MRRLAVISKDIPLIVSAEKLPGASAAGRSAVRRQKSEN
jgi:hypothetical protein